MSLEERLQSSSQQFHRHLDDIHAILANASEDIVPAVVAELKADPAYSFDFYVGAEGDGVPNEEEKESALRGWLEDWVNDLGQIYRVHKKNDYDTLATLDAIHRTLVWRAKNVGHLPPSTPTGFLRFIPHPLINLDPGERTDDAKGEGKASSNSAPSPNVTRKASSPPPPRPPILLLNLKELTQMVSSTSSADSDEKAARVKTALVHVFEVSRLYLAELDGKLKAASAGDGKGKQRALEEEDEEEEERLRMLQFVLMVDVQGAGTIPNLGTDISRWVTEEVAPNYPGLCSAVFIVNYSWTYGALWAVIKRVLPQKILSRISFPSEGELLDRFPPEYLLREHEGTLSPFLPDYDPIMARYQRRLRPTIISDSASSTSTLVPGRAESRPSTPRPRPRTPRPRTPRPPEPTTPAKEGLTLSSAEPLDLPSPIYLDPFSPHNPFYGYPTVVRYRALPDGTFSAVPHLVHGRRRKRDLFKALAFLFLLQWKTKMGAWVRIVLGAKGKVGATARRKYLTLKTVGRILGLDLVPGAGVVLSAVVVVAAALLVRLRRIREQQQHINGRDSGGGGILSVLKNPVELSWLLLRDVLMGGVGAGAAAGLGMLTPEIVLTMPATI